MRVSAKKLTADTKASRPAKKTLSAHISACTPPGSDRIEKYESSTLAESKSADSQAIFFAKA